MYWCFFLFGVLGVAPYNGNGSFAMWIDFAIFDLVILAKFCQIAKLKHSPNFPVIRYVSMTQVECCGVLQAYTKASF